MRLLFFFFISIQAFCFSQYVYGSGVYFSLDLNYQKEYLKETQTLNGNTSNETYSGEGKNYGFSFAYAINQQHFISLEYSRNNTTIDHMSSFFVYSDKEIGQSSSDLVFNTFRAQYWYFFQETSIFVGGGIEFSTIDMSRESIFYKKYKKRVTGLMVIGTQIGDQHFMLLPFISYVVPFKNLRKTYMRSLSVTEIRLGLKLMFKIL